MEPHGLAAVDTRPDRRRLRPAKRSKVGAETSSLQVMQVFRAHSGDGPLLGTDDPLSVLFNDELNRFLSMTGKLYQLSDDELSVELKSVLFPTSPPPPNCGKVGFTTHEPKQFLAVFG
mmetsp:Transcript_2431/g.5130  ORF Transcript_2431/g.5130 Transcript_2431/m.5130 type:complete len:118 (+) Transcript_2431:454-807(+)